MQGEVSLLGIVCALNLSATPDKKTVGQIYSDTSPYLISQNFLDTQIQVNHYKLCIFVLSLCAGGLHRTEE